MEFLRKIEEKWQKAWEKAKIFEADPDPKRRKFFVTFPYPYINGPLHVGHAFTASRIDAYARFKRMQGYNVLFPWAWHWTGQPLIGASERVANGDREFIRVLKEMDGVPEEELKKFVDPIYMATYYTNESRIAAKQAGFSVDWRREFNTVMPAFQKFIEWQYENLRAKGYVRRGTHPVVWCPKCKSPTGDHDRQEGEGVTPEEYTLIKFKFDEDTYLPAATFRPETIYGVTNIWIHPEALYVEAQVDNEKWVISERAAEKLKEQGRELNVKRELKGRELVGKTFENPVNNSRLPILPGWFVDPTQATGVVYSVPAHAPYDWLGLKDLQEKPEILRQFGVDPETVKSIKPISMIKVEDFGEYPAIEIVERLGVKDQHDPKAEEATKLLYKKEFHSGILKENCMEYSDRTVQEVKETLIEDFKKRGIADSMYDLPQRVVCRCLTPCIVKILQDQWFLTYSDPEWKEEVKKALSEMKIYPKTATQWFLAVIDWLNEWACARRTGLGTPLSWSPGWIVETLSDSTIYMAFYTINKHIRKHAIKPEMLTKEVFDYLFYGKGHLKNVAAGSLIEAEILDEMREEFLYWYPVDLRVSAKELVPNHLTFFLFQHVALFPPEQWPKAIGVNGMLMIEGRQMHKSKGNFVTMKGAIEENGADATKCALLLGAEGMDDPNWRSESVRDIRNKLEAFYNFAKNIVESAENEETGRLEKWLMSSLQNRISEVTENLEQMKTRTALEIAFFEIWNDFRWYMRRKGNMKARILRNALKIWLRLLAPFAPHISEEIRSLLGGKTFVALAPWPEPNEELIDVTVEQGETFIKDVIEDTKNIMRATGTKPAKVYYYTSAPWKWKLYRKMMEKATSEKLEPEKLIRELLKEPELREKAKEVAKIAPKIAEEILRMPRNKQDRQLKAAVLDEKKIIESAKPFLNQEFEAEIRVFEEYDQESYDPKQRAKLSKPYRPAIFIE
jgi:leucyl-tRNA synthetase